jgi:hypothetical protein
MRHSRFCKAYIASGCLGDGRGNLQASRARRRRRLNSWRRGERLHPEVAGATFVSELPARALTVIGHVRTRRKRLASANPTNGRLSAAKGCGMRISWMANELLVLWTGGARRMTRRHRWILPAVNGSSDLARRFRSVAFKFQLPILLAQSLI